MTQLIPSAIRYRGLLAALVACTALLTLTLVACGGDDDDDGGDAPAPTDAPAATEAPTEAPTPEPTEVPVSEVDPKEVLTLASVNFTALRKFAFVLEYENGALGIEELGVDMNRVEGDIIIPDQLSATLDATARQLGGINVSVSAIGIGELAWVTNPFDPSQWLELEGGNPLQGMFDPGAGVEAVANTATNPVITGDDTIDGVETWVIEADLDAGDLQAFAADATAGYPIEGIVWIGKDDLKFRRIELHGPMSENDPDDIVIILELADTDIDAINPPQ